MTGERNTEKGKPSHEERARQAVENLVEVFESGELPEAVARTLIQADIPCANWSLSNRLIVFLCGTQDARGFRQWEKVERKVKKGARAIYILAPVMGKCKVTEPDPESGEEVEKVIQYVKGFKSVPVFAIEDTEGEPVDYQLQPVELPPLYDVAEKLGVSVQYAPTIDPALCGFYLPGADRGGEDRIVLMDRTESTFWHELAHAAHSHLTRKQGGKLQKKGSEGRQEVVAESVAATLSLMYGREGFLKDCYGYIERYGAKVRQESGSGGEGTPGEGESSPVKAILSVISEIEKVLSVILSMAAAGEQAAQSAGEEGETRAS